MRLLERSRETAVIDAAIARAREGAGSVIVLSADAGLGKSALMAYAAERSPGMTVLRCRGYESESTLAFAALSDLLRPVAHRTAELADAQRVAVDAAIALGPPSSDDRLTVAVAVLTLLSLVADESPVLVLVDDAHWLDAASAEAIAFAVRRLELDAVAVIISVRPGHPAFVEVEAMQVVAVQPLSRAGALEVLSTTPAPAVERDRIVELAAGNPLALLELGSEGVGRAGSESAPQPGTRIRDAYLRRVHELPPETRRALLVAAAAGRADARVIGRALVSSGLSLSQLEIAESRGLVSLDSGSVGFVHPLARSAVYDAAVPADRRAAHLALAAAFDQPGGEDARALHLADGTVEPDEGVAAALEESARRALAVSAYTTAARLFERSALLSPDDARRARRLVDAAGACQIAGDVSRARTLLGTAPGATRDPDILAAIDEMRGRVEARGGSPQIAHDAFVAAADRCLPDAPEAAALALVEAIDPCIRAGKPAEARQLADRALDLLGSQPSAPAVYATLGRAAADMFVGDSLGASRLVDSAAGLVEVDGLGQQLAAYLGTVLAFSERFGQAREVLDPLTARARDRSAPGDLVFPLISLGWCDRATGRWSDASAGLSEAAASARDAGRANDECWALSVLSWISAARGDAQSCLDACERQEELDRELGLPYQRACVHASRGLLALGSRDLDVATHELRLALETKLGYGYCDITTHPRVGPDLIEALVLGGDRDAAQAVFERLEGDARASQSPAALAWAAACGALLDATDAPPDQIEETFAPALARFELLPDPFGRARVELWLGGLLRRNGLRVRAREVVRSALEAFESLGAEPWAEIARGELRASGARLQRRDTASHTLTPQEWQVASLVAEGLTNKDVAARLFVSPKTVEAHLTHIYAKLGARSRTHLARLLDGVETAPDA